MWCEKAIQAGNSKRPLPPIPRDETPKKFRKPFQIIVFNKKDIITILALENPKTRGTKAYDKYQFLVRFAGLTVGEFLKEAKKQEKVFGKNWAKPELVFCLKKGYIQVGDLTQASLEENEDGSNEN